MYKDIEVNNWSSEDPQTESIVVFVLHLSNYVYISAHSIYSTIFIPEYQNCL